ncbi:MAG TPA: GrpB family protein [Actinomycetes bacterium]|nr:GrpB family protein [Actinomycetes bacterium]
MTVQAPQGAGPSRAGAETAASGPRRAWRSRGRHAAASCVPAPGPAPSPSWTCRSRWNGWNPVEPFRSPLEAAGFLYRAANTERTKRYFREPPGQRRTHVHVRRAGSFSEQFPLLLRDFLRWEPGPTDA